jgi:hypothetical protein
MMTTPEILIQRARDTAHLETFDSMSFTEGLEILCADIDSVTTFRPGARERLHDQIVELLTKRLAVADYRRQNPAQVNLPVVKPLFVVGMPRTGTTALINLLDQDPSRRTMLKWELADPVPPAGAAERRSDPRALRLLAEQRASVEAGTLPANIHMEWADSPTECVYLMGWEFKGLLWDAQARFPGYSRHSFECDMSSAYDWHKRFHQMKQGSEDVRWTLKAPSHILWIPELLAAYPDARLVWTHRDPFTALASQCSLMAQIHERYSDHPDLGWIRQRYPHYMREHLRRPMQLPAHQKERIYDLLYNDVMRNPIGALKGVYSWLGEEFSTELQNGIEGWLAANPKGKHGRHHYGLEQFGISKAEVAPLFSDYLAEYNVPLDD